MADLAGSGDVRGAMDDLCARDPARVVPIAYVNSSAETKAIVGAGGGACCTSSNAEAVFGWALSPDGAGGAKVFCLPDQHLGRNTAVAMGFALEDCAVYDPALPGGGLSDDEVRGATFVLWRGHCYVHQVFTPEQVREARAADPDVRVIVHPECPREVVELADEAGSTSAIIRAVGASPAGTHWAVATESELVERLARRHPDRRVEVLCPGRAVCEQMKAVDLGHLAWCLEEIVAGREPNRIAVSPDVAADARKALERMIALG
jgi:quinolinate synthase